MVTTEYSEKLKAFTDKVIVIPIDGEKLSNEMDAKYKSDVKKVEGTMFAKTVEPNATFRIRERFCIIKNTPIIIDTECVGEITKEDTTSFYFYKDLISENGKKSFFLSPEFGVKITLTELIKDYSLPETTLTEFMGDRFAYNSRVCGNTQVILDEIKKY